MSRKTARDIAMKMVFARTMSGEAMYQSVLEQSGMKDRCIDEDVAYLNDIINGIESRQDELDSRIEKHTIGWTLERIPKVDLCILRLALYEMLYCNDIPHSVSINEAVELAKKYSGERSPAFVNGILGTLEKEIQENEVFDKV